MLQRQYIMAISFKFITYALLYCCTAAKTIPSNDQQNSSGVFNSEELIISSFHEGLEIVNATLFHTMTRQRTTRSPMQTFTFLRQAEPWTQEISRAAEFFETSLHILKDRESRRHKRDLTLTEFLSWENVKLIADLSGCLPSTSSVHCPQDYLSDKYRSISGVCNNRHNPFWGEANTALARWLPAEYEDGERQPKGWNQDRLYNGLKLPKVHKVSKNILQSSSKQMAQDDVYSQMLVDWGQYIDHDISFTPQSTSKATFLEGLDCLSTCENINPCFPIEVTFY